MKLKVVIDPHHEEEVTIYAHKRNELIEKIERLLSENSMQFIGYDQGIAIPLLPDDVYCFVVEDNKIFALTKTQKLQLKSRLYKIEECLPPDFIKINQSCVVNKAFIKQFDASVSGSLVITMQNGYTDYVSRRNLKQVKERLYL